MDALLNTVEGVGLLIQTMGAFLVGLLCLMLNRVQRHEVLSAWAPGWFALGVALLALAVQQGMPTTSAVTLPVYIFGENAFGLAIVLGCLRLRGRGFTMRQLSVTLAAFALWSAALPQLVGYDFRHVFLVQALSLAGWFGSAWWLLPPAARSLPATGLAAMRLSLVALTLLFAVYVPVFAADIAGVMPLPMTLLRLSSALHLILEFMLGFGAAVIVLEQAHHGLVRQLNALSEDQLKLREQADRDPLTGLLNRRGLRSRLATLLDVTSRDSRSLSVFFIDLDHFKSVNDVLGHAAGDQLLISVARRLQQAVRADDLVARLGGDEFMIVSARTQGRFAASQLADRVIQLLSDAVHVEERACSVGASIGIALSPGDGRSGDELLSSADRSLYAAKAAGRGRHAFAGDRVEERAQATA